MAKAENNRSTSTRKRMVSELDEERKARLALAKQVEQILTAQKKTRN